MGFHIDGSGAGHAAQQALVFHRGDRPVDAGDLCEHRAGQCRQQVLRPGRIRAPAPVSLADRRADNAGPGLQRRIEPAGNPEADDARGTLGHSALQAIGEAGFIAAADHRVNLPALGDARLARESDGGNDAT